MAQVGVLYGYDAPTSTSANSIANFSLSSPLWLPASDLPPHNITPSTGQPMLTASKTGCSDKWSDSHHMLYQIAHTALLVGFMAPMTTQGLLFFHGTLLLGFLLLSTWGWAVLCSPDIFSWNFTFTFINAGQVFLILYKLRPVKFSCELEDLYETMFLPFGVTRHQFKKMTSSEFCDIATLHQGEAYATQEVTRTDRLSLLISGMAHVNANGHFLHHIQEKQFLDSPEFESTSHSDDKFHVSIIGASTGRYITWQRTALEYLFAKEPYLGVVLGNLLGRDITNKLYLLNDKLKVQKGVRVDIRLPNVSVAAIGGIDLRTCALNKQLNHRHDKCHLAEREEDEDGEMENDDHEADDDYYINTSEKSTLMTQDWRKPGNLTKQHSTSTPSSVSSR